MMSELSKTLIDQALELPANERLLVAEKLLISLDRPDAEIDKLWAEECEDRLQAFDRGEIEAVPASQLLLSR